MASADDFEIPTLDEIRQRARDGVLALVRKASLTVASDYDVFTRVMATLLVPIFGSVRFAARQFFPPTAVEKYLIIHGQMRNMPRKEASVSDGLALLRGLVGATQPAGATISAASGIEVTTTAARTCTVAAWANQTVLFYDVRRPNTIVVSSTIGMSVGDIFGINGNYYAIKDLPGGGAVIIYGRFKVVPRTAAPADVMFPEPGALLPIQSKEKGATSNMEYATVLTFLSPVVNPDCEVLELSGAANIEELTDWARRMQDHDAERAAANNRSQALQLMLDQLGVGEAYVWDVYRGLGTADMTPQGVKGARHLSTVRIGQLQNRIAPRPPTDANPGFVAIGGHDWLFTDFTDFFVSVDVILTGGVGFGPDWVGTLTTAAGCTTSRINTTTDPRPLLAIGTRVVIPTGPPLFIEQSAINSVDAGGFGLEEVLTSAPPAGRIIYPGSNLIEPVRDNLLDMFNDMGPGDTTPPSRYPSPTTRGPANLTLNLLHAVIRAVAGVADVRIIAPITNVSPPPKAQCVPLDIVLRYA